MNASISMHSNSTVSSDITKTSYSSFHGQQSIIDAHLMNLYARLATLKQQNPETISLDSNRLKALLDAYHYSCLQLEARYKIEEQRIDSRYESETRSTKTHFAAKKIELKEHLMDRFRRKRKLVVEEMRSAIDIHSRSFDADPLLVTMQPPHPLQAKAYNFRQRPEMVQGTYSSVDDEFSSSNISNSGLVSPIPQPQFARKRLVGAFTIFPMPRWTVRDEECEDDLRLIMNHRR